MSIFLLFYSYRKILEKYIDKFKITLAILNDICYYIDKDRYKYRFGDKYTDNNIIVTLELN